MTDVAMVDYRRPDLRTNVLTNPYWISSGLIVGGDSEDKYAVLFSFPRAGSVCRVLDVCFQVVVPFTAGTTCDIGTCTLATDDITTGGVATLVDADDFLLNADLTIGTAGYYFATTAHTSDWLTMKAANSGALPFTQVGAITNVPAIMATFANAATILAGKARVHMLIVELPGSYQ